MAEESFEDWDGANELNENFICVSVDCEQEP
ncbi:DUF255 domain-containing protein [bacterium]|nr:DUF255 domain-containing protein [bacterium]